MHSMIRTKHRWGKRHFTFVWCLVCIFDNIRAVQNRQPALAPFSSPWNKQPSGESLRRFFRLFVLWKCHGEKETAKIYLPWQRKVMEVSLLLNKFDLTWKVVTMYPQGNCRCCLDCSVCNVITLFSLPAFSFVSLSSKVASRPSGSWLPLQGLNYNFVFDILSKTWYLPKTMMYINSTAILHVFQIFFILNVTCVSVAFWRIIGCCSGVCTPGVFTLQLRVISTYFASHLHLLSQ